MNPSRNGNDKKPGAGFAGLMLTTEAMIADVQEEKGEGGMGGMGGGMGGMGMGM